MAGKCSTFWGGLDENMVKNPVLIFRTVDINQVTESLEKWRIGMQALTPDLSQVHLQADLVIYDICNLIGLDDGERLRVMGAELAAAVEAQLDEGYSIREG